MASRRLTELICALPPARSTGSSTPMGRANQPRFTCCVRSWLRPLAKRSLPAMTSELIPAGSDSGLEWHSKRPLSTPARQESKFFGFKGAAMA